MNDKLRYGIIGCGSMGREHILNLQAMGGAEVTAISDPHAASRDAAAMLVDSWRPRLFVQHADLLHSGLCDALVIASPNHTHAAVLHDTLATDLAHPGGKTAGHQHRRRPGLAGPRPRPPSHHLGGAGITLHAAGGRNDPPGPRG